MKRGFNLIRFLVIMLFIAGCSVQEEMIEGSTFYVGNSEHWLETYSISKVEETYYDSMTLQYLFGNEGIVEVGPVEFELQGNGQLLSTQYPKNLEGVGGLHTNSVSNANFISLELNQEMDLMVKWKNQTETIKLKRVND